MVLGWSLIRSLWLWRGRQYHGLGNTILDGIGNDLTAIVNANGVINGPSGG